MKKVLAIVATLALVGVLYISPAKDQKEQSTKVVQENTYRMMVDPGGGMG
ncbi:hypothetical protein NLU03_10920 [Bacillus toyonensis]|nr:hypothetical protein [Bacillus toyonensis]